MAETFSESPDLLSPDTPEFAPAYLNEATAEPAAVFEHIADEAEIPAVEDHEALTIAAQAAARPAQGEILEPLKAHEIIQLLLLVDNRLDKNREWELNPEARTQNPAEPIPFRSNQQVNTDRMAA